jgi:hypothetical protein
MFGRRNVEFLHKRSSRIFSLLAFGELASGGFFQKQCKGSIFYTPIPLPYVYGFFNSSVT